MEKILDLRGKWQLKGEGLSHCEVYLPGTLDTNQVGHKDTPELATRLTRLHTWEGKRLVQQRNRASVCRGRQTSSESGTDEKVGSFYRWKRDRSF